jgi:DNA repair and recombination RAD54-like protein
MSDTQRDMYCYFVDHPKTKAELRGKEAKPLVAINILKKLVNHPELLPVGKVPNKDDWDNKKDAEKEKEMCTVFEERLPAGWGDRRDVHTEWSGKFLVLERSAVR